METYDIPRTFSLDDTLYGISMYVANICMTFLLLLLFDIKNAFGLVYMVPAFVAHVLAKMDPDRFYYIWDGWFNVLKILGSILYIYSFYCIGSVIFVFNSIVGGSSYNRATEFGMECFFIRASHQSKAKLHIGAFGISIRYHKCMFNAIWSGCEKYNLYSKVIVWRTLKSN